jgi:hypothetical protein
MYEMEGPRPASREADHRSLGARPAKADRLPR